MRIRIDDIKVNDRIRQDYGDIQALAEDIEKNGLIQPPVISEDHVLIAGGRRLQAMKSLGWTETDVHMVSVHDEEHRLNMEISENEVRKDFTMEERLDLAKRLERIERIKAEQRMKDPMQNFAEGEKGNTRDKVAEKLDFGSGEQYRKAKYVSDHRDQLKPADYAGWNQGAISTNRAYQQLKEAQADQEMGNNPPEDPEEIKLDRHIKRATELIASHLGLDLNDDPTWRDLPGESILAGLLLEENLESAPSDQELDLIAEPFKEGLPLSYILARAYLFGFGRGYLLCHDNYMKGKF